MQTQLDWSAYANYGEGDAYAQLPASGGAYGKAAAVCIGSRHCQRLEQGVMCPSYRITRDIKHSTWHRARTLKAALNGDYGPNPFAGPELAEAMDLCIGCKGCKRECPNGTDMALMRAEFLAQRWLRLGVSVRDRLFAYLPRYAGWLGWLRGLIRLRERWPVLAGLSERWLGIARHRALPQVAADSFFSCVRRLPAAEPAATEVALFVDTFSNYFSPEAAQAALGVLQTAGYSVHIVRPPAGQRPLCCGRTFLSQGLIGEARREAQRVVAALAPYAARKIPVIGLEPSCLLMLRDEYHALDLDADIKALAKSALLLEEFLARENDARRLRLRFVSLPATRVLVHGHCHQKAFGAMKAVRKVLGLIPDLEAEFVESSCCGMAGSFGMEAEHYSSSMQMAELNLLPAIRASHKRTLLVANGHSCRQQILDGAGRESLHLAVLLRAALAPLSQQPARGETVLTAALQ